MPTESEEPRCVSSSGSWHETTPTPNRFLPQTNNPGNNLGNMLISLTVGKVDAGIAILLTEDRRLVRFIPSIQCLAPFVRSKMGRIKEWGSEVGTKEEEKVGERWREVEWGEV